MQRQSLRDWRLSDRNDPGGNQDIPGTGGPGSRGSQLTYYRKMHLNGEVVRDDRARAGGSPCDGSSGYTSTGSGGRETETQITGETSLSRKYLAARRTGFNSAKTSG